MTHAEFVADIRQLLLGEFVVITDIHSSDVYCGHVVSVEPAGTDSVVITTSEHGGFCNIMPPRCTNVIDPERRSIRYCERGHGFQRIFTVINLKKALPGKMYHPYGDREEDEMWYRIARKFNN